MGEVIRYILKRGSGYRDELIVQFGEDFVDELCMLGYITQGATLDEGNSYKRTWKMTKKAEDYFHFFLADLTEKEKERGRYLHKIGF